MKLYVTRLGRWAGTQAEIKALGKEDGGWVERDVPTDKPSLIAWLNGYREEVYVEGLSTKPEPDFAEEDISDLLGEDEPVVVPKIITDPKDYPKPQTVRTHTPAQAQAALTPGVVAEWLLETANPMQVEHIFAALGARFHEAIKGEKK